MTNLDKQVRRKTRGVYRVLYQVPRAIVVSLMAGDILEFREAGRRRRYQLAIDTAFRYAVRLKAEQTRLERKQARKVRRGK